MNFQTPKQQVLDSNKQLRNNWTKVREIWQDEKSDQFYKTYILQLERQMKAAMDSIDEIDELFKEIQKDCF